MSIYEDLLKIIEGIKGEIKFPIEEGVSLHCLDGEVNLVFHRNCVKCRIPIETVEEVPEGFMVNNSIFVEVHSDCTLKVCLKSSESVPKFLESLMKGKVDFKIECGNGSRISFRRRGGPPMMECGPVLEHLVGREIKFLEKTSENTFAYKLGDIFLYLPESSIIKIHLG